MVQPYSLMSFLPHFQPGGTAVVDSFSTASNSMAATGRHRQLKAKITRKKLNFGKMMHQTGSANTRDRFLIEIFSLYSRMYTIYKFA